MQIGAYRFTRLWHLYCFLITSVSAAGSYELCCRQHKVQWDWRVMLSQQMGLSSVVSLEVGTLIHWRMVLPFVVVAVVATQDQLNKPSTDTQCAALLERFHTYSHCSLLDSSRKQKKTCAETCTVIVSPSDSSLMPVLPMDNFLWYCWWLLKGCHLVKWCSDAHWHNLQVYIFKHYKIRYFTFIHS